MPPLFVVLPAPCLQAQQAHVNLDWNPQKNTQNLLPYGVNLISPEVRDERTVIFRVRSPRAAARAGRAASRKRKRSISSWWIERSGKGHAHMVSTRICGHHVWKILGAMNWTLQRPAQQAKERNQEARQQWITEWWPEPPAPEGVDPFPRPKWHLRAALGYRWDGRRCRLWFQTRPGSYNAESLIGYLKDLKRHLRGQKSILV